MFKIASGFFIVVFCFMFFVTITGILNADPYFEIFKVKPDGLKNEVQLTESPYRHWAPCWSPDGSWIVYQRWDDNDIYQIWKVDSAGNTEVQLTDENEHHYRPEWSPDGNWIVYDRNDATDRQQIYKVDTTGAGIEIALTNSSYHHHYPKWSPDGNWIAYMTYWSPGGSHVYKIPSGGGAEVQLTTGDAWNGGWEPVSWSPNGDWISYVFKVGGNDGINQIFKVDTAGNTEVQLTFESLSHRWPHWSPDGKCIAYAGWTSGRGICKVDTAGGPEVILNTQINGVYNDWDPSSEWVVCCRGKIWKVDSGGSSELQLTANSAYVARWSSDGNWIVYTQSAEVTGIELVYFTATAKNRFVLLKWQSSIGNGNVNYFIIKRKEKEGDYEELTTIPAQGGSSAQTYSYEDHAVEPYNSYWYKLGCSDKDNNIKWYDPVKVVYGGKDLPGVLKLRVIPTISNRDFHVSYDIKKQSDILAKFPVNFTIYDASGRVVRVLLEGQLRAGSYNSVWNGEDVNGRAVKPGIYFCKLEIDGSASETIKVMVIR